MAKDKSRPKKRFSGRQGAIELVDIMIWGVKAEAMLDAQDLVLNGKYGSSRKAKLAGSTSEMLNALAKLRADLMNPSLDDSTETAMRLPKLVKPRRREGPLRTATIKFINEEPPFTLKHAVHTIWSRFPKGIQSRTGRPMSRDDFRRQVHATCNRFVDQGLLCTTSQGTDLVYFLADGPIAF